MNADGFDDVMIGAELSTNFEYQEGSVYIYYGNADAMNPTPTVLEINQSYALFGQSISNGGDMNMDGYDDIIVGARDYDDGQYNEGGAFIYHGSAEGILTTPVMTMECDQANAWMGYSVAGGGDVNGDGRVDIIVGAPDFDDGEADEGAAFIYYPDCVPTSEICNAIDDDCNGFIDDMSYTIDIYALGPTTFCQGGSVILNAIGTGPAYQWQKNGVDIPGAT